MKMFKKIMAAALAAVMVLAMLTACTGAGSGNEEQVLNALNQTRTQNYGLNALTRSEEADANAQHLMTFLQRYYDGSIGLGDAALNQEVDHMMQTMAEGCGFKQLFVTFNASGISTTDFIGERVATEGNAELAGLASGTTQNQPFTVVVIY